MWFCLALNSTLPTNFFIHSKNVGCDWVKDPIVESSHLPEPPGLNPAVILDEDEEMGTHIPTATKQHLLDHIAESQLPLELSRPTDTLGDFLAAKVAAQ